MVEKIGNEQLKNIELAILLDVANFCEANSIRYYLCGGTLIGAIRHKGVIPWDDDIDIIMPRPDYMKFLKLYNQRDSFYRVNSVFNDSDWYSTFAEVEDIRTVKIYNGFNQKSVHGVNIDIFPTDGSPDDERKRKRFWKINNFLARVATLSNQRFKVSKHFSDQTTGFSTIKTYIRTGVKFLAIPLARCTKPFHLNLLINKRAMKYDVDSSEFIGASTFPHYGYKECIHGKPFLKITKRQFEGYMLNTPDNYGEYLGNLYGDYMKVPPKDKQVSHHDFEAYWKDDGE